MSREPSLRRPNDSDWPAILRVANDALPNAPDGNAAWLEARQRFNDNTRRRRHYVAEGNGEIVGYGAVEEASPGRWRTFVVMSPEQLNGGIGDRMLRQLLADIHDLGGGVAWMREQADDRSLLAFVASWGFKETRRYTIDDPSAEAYVRVEVVELEGGASESG